MNKKTWVLTLIVVMLISTAVFAWGGKSGDKNASGRITDLKVWAAGASVKGITEDGSLWLAYTVYWSDGYERDYTPIKVKGAFSKSLTFQARPQGLDEVIVCLWRYKVSKSRCAKDNGGTACQYCQKNGIHMEGRIDRKTGS